MTPKTRFYRFLEIVPGSLVWLTLISAISLSFVRPLWVMYFIIVFDTLWLFRVSYFVFYLTVSWWRYRRDTRIDWLPRAMAHPRFRELKHVIFLPFVNEDVDVIGPTLRNLAESDYPVRESFIVVLCGEARAGEDHFNRVFDRMKSEFGDRFFRFEGTLHPADLPDEIPGKGSNLSYAGQQIMKSVIDPLGLRYEDVTVSMFDCDTTVHGRYFAYLAYKYLNHPNPTRSSFQPVALYNNNIWESPAAVRVSAFGTTFWLLTELARPERMFTFASHSMPLQMLVDVGWWQRDVVSDDSRIFLQAYLHYDGEYEVTPLYMPISMDTVMTGGYRKALGALYRQQRRWAWGVENLPYFIVNSLRHPAIPWRKRIFHTWNMMEGMYTWATAPLLMFLLGYLPIWLAPESLRSAAFYQNTPHTLETLMTLSMAGVLVSGILSFTLLPPKPTHRPRWFWLFMILQWALLPVTFIVFGAFPAIDAQTRMMLGRYLGFNVTEKKRQPNPS
ncbi:glycosyltransferase family 2 protein [Candidatus Uhrbacteria bacterium]|nr:glycosyltransferase family 2 protein [Candidatus Uhrbacteria bacterium]